MTNNNFAEWVDIKDRKPEVSKMYVVKYKRTSLSDERTITLQWKDDSFYEIESLIDSEFYSFYWLKDDDTKVKGIKGLENPVQRNPHAYVEYRKY